MTALIMLDLSAAFNVINQPTLLNHLEFSFDIKEKPLTWVKSYLTDKSVFQLRIKHYEIRVFILVYQKGSVLGARNDCMYTKPVDVIIKRHNIKYHYYADNTQL